MVKYITMRHIRNIGLGILLILIPWTTYVLFHYIPGTLIRDTSGFPHGTGWFRYYYDSGSLMLEEYYRNGTIRLSRWYRPDGDYITETRWNHGDGIEYYLRQDGTIHTQIEYRNNHTDGIITYFKEDGITIDRNVNFQNGYTNIPNLSGDQIQSLIEQFLTSFPLEPLSWIWMEPYLNQDRNPPIIDEEILRQFGLRYTIYKQMTDIPKDFIEIGSKGEILRFHGGIQISISIQFKKYGAVRIDYKVFRGADGRCGGWGDYQWNTDRWELHGSGNWD
jgi:hypothetical protein